MVCRQHVVHPMERRTVGILSSKKRDEKRRPIYIHGYSVPMLEAAKPVRHLIQYRPSFYIDQIYAAVAVVN
jgi:hypothetical protein